MDTLDPSMLARLAQYAQRWNAHPSLAAFGVQVAFPDANRVQVEVNQISASMRGGLGDDTVVNGAALSAMCDLLIGSTAALVDAAGPAGTLQLSIRFERALRGQRITGVGRIDRATARTIFASAELSDEQGQVCVRCQGLVALLRSSPG
jgi:acyl-coenzyme A thioesterase PaaI-like protein